MAVKEISLGTNKGKVVEKVINQDGNFYTCKNQSHKSPHIHRLTAYAPREEAT